MPQEALAALHRQAVTALNQGRFESAHRSCLEILRRDPGFSDAYFLLGMIAASHGNITKALDLIERAEARRPKCAEYLAQKARCLLLLHRTGDAIAAARSALDYAPADALTLDTIGVVMTRAGDHEGAIEALRRAVAAQPDNPQFLFNLGSSQQFLGHFGEAANSYEAAIENDPLFFRAHWALSELGPATGDGSRIERLQRLLDCNRDNQEAVRYLCHALAKEHERSGHFAEAFEYWRRGKESIRSASSDGGAYSRTLFEEITTVCSSGFVSEGAGFQSTEPIFVVGMPRTGTTLVEKMLGAHDAVFAAGELNEFGLTIKEASKTRSRLILDVETVRSAGNLDYSIVGRRYVERTRYLTGHTPRFVDKLPPNFLYAGFIHRALPRAKIVCLRRNPLDTCLSNFRQLFTDRSPYYGYASDLLETGRYYLRFAELIRHWQSVLPASVFMVTDYESLVADPETGARRLLEFCELDWNDKVLDFHSSNQPVATASAVQVRKPVYTDAVGRWKRYASQVAPLSALFAEHGVDC